MNGGQLGLQNVEQSASIAVPLPDKTPSVDEVVFESHRFAARVESLLSSLEQGGAGDAYGIRITRALLGSLVESLNEMGPMSSRMR